jgi:hypothetical protein
MDFPVRKQVRGKEPLGIRGGTELSRRGRRASLNFLGSYRIRKAMLISSEECEGRDAFSRWIES